MTDYLIDHRAEFRPRGLMWLSQSAVLQADISTGPTIAAYSLNLHCDAYPVVTAPCGFLCVHYQVKGKDASRASNFSLLRGTYISGAYNDATTSEVRLQHRLTARARSIYLLPRLHRRANTETLLRNQICCSVSSPGVA
jgi:hypothetical protein